MDEKLKNIILKDVDEITEILEETESYDFSKDLKQRMQKAQLSSVSLGQRAFVTHTIVDKWLHGKARPNGKERMKELGMALGFDLGELDTFLFKNGYPKLYVKNALDSAAKSYLLRIAGDPKIVESYRNLVKRMGLDSVSLNDGYVSLSSKIMSAELREAAAQSSFSRWFRENNMNFTDDAKKQLPDFRIGRYMSLYIGDSTINEMSATGELPSTIKNLLYSLVSGKTVNTRGLRDRIIAFGLYSNMTPEEIDILLDCVRVRRITDPESRLDFIVMLALRIAHDRYPYYEYENTVRIVERLKKSSDEFDKQILSDYLKNYDNLKQMVEYYDHSDNDENQIFERYYTSYSDRSIMDYVRDMLVLFKEKKILTEEDVKPIWEMIQREDEED